MLRSIAKKVSDSSYRNKYNIYSPKKQFFVLNHTKGEPHMNNNDVVVSLSGGMDSTGLLLRLLNEGRKVYALSFFYGQKHSVELERLKLNLSYLKEKGFNIEHNVVDLSSIMGLFHSALTEKDFKVPEGHYADENMKQTVVPNRNAIFSSLIFGYALSIATRENKDIDIALGVHDGDHCFSKNTQILTPDGLKSIDELKVGDKIYSLNDKFINVEDTLIDIIKKNKVKTINSIRTSSGILELTDEHNVYAVDFSDYNNNHGWIKTIVKKKVKDLTVDDYLITSRVLPVKDKEIKETIDILPICEELILNYPNFYIEEREGKIFLLNVNKFSSNSIKPDRFLNKKALFDLMGWYITEGYTAKAIRKGDSRFNSCFFQSISKNLSNSESIIQTMKDLGYIGKVQYSKKKNSLGVPFEMVVSLSGVMSLLAQSCGRISSEKKIPEWMMAELIQDTELRLNFLDTLIAGDGHINVLSNTNSYVSKSFKLIQQVSFLAKLSGFNVGISYPRKSVSTYSISFGNTGKETQSCNIGGVSLSKVISIDTIEYNDYVYDLSIKDNHNFYAGDIGGNLISNSIYPDCRPEFYESIQESFKLGNWDSEKVNYYLPFMFEDKYYILKDSIDSCNNLDLDFTTVFSNTNTCYAPNERGESCGKCGSCIERLEAFGKLQIKDPVKYV